jgi:hypothetical protein
VLDRVVAASNKIGSSRFIVEIPPEWAFVEV